ncbi:MAG: aromatic/alkene monooxygenase hydroxylase subunit beta [Gammaproteobacteria bacterium]
MSIDLKTTNIEPIRRTFDHLAEKLGPDKNPTRYQEATFGLQPEVNQHYRPTWDPDCELYDRRRTAIVMEDFDDLTDPRQYYYGTWTIQRGKQQESQENNFQFVESKHLMAALDDDIRAQITQFVLPLRHVAWGANTNNNYIAAYGFGAPVTSAATLHMMDQLGIAQYLTRIGLVLNDNEPAILDEAMDLWMNDARWQPLRETVENMMVTKDWFELFVAQNLVLDGMLYPLLLEHFDAHAVSKGAAGYSMMTGFMTEWFKESSRWVDSVIKIAGKESDANAALLKGWHERWLPAIKTALLPLAEYALEDNGAALEEVAAVLAERAGKIGL